MGEVLTRDSTFALAVDENAIEERRHFVEVARELALDDGAHDRGDLGILEPVA